MAKLKATPDEWSNQGSQWKAGRTFLNLYDAELVEMRLESRNDISCGPGYHGSDWMIRRTDAGRAIIASIPLPNQKEKGL